LLRSVVCPAVLEPVAGRALLEPRDRGAVLSRVPTDRRGRARGGSRLTARVRRHACGARHRIRAADARALPPRRRHFARVLRHGHAAVELFVGALLAVLFSRRLIVKRYIPRLIVLLLGTAALVATIVVWVTTDQYSTWLYQGGLAVYALGSAAIIAAALQPGLVR